MFYNWIIGTIISIKKYYDNKDSYIKESVQIKSLLSEYSYL